MALYQIRSKTKPSGGKKKSGSKRRLAQIARAPTHTKLDVKKLRKNRIRGGSLKPRLLSENIANVFDKKTKVCKKVKITGVTDNPANRHFVRRNIITKGTVINTELGKAKITSRPGQDGIVNAVLIN